MGRRFRYLGMDEAGRARSGEIAAADPAAARRALGALGIAVTSIDGGAAVRGGRRLGWWGGVRPVLATDLVLLFRQLRLLLRAGVPLLEAVERCRDACSSARLAAALDAIRASIAGGSGLAHGMAHGRVFDPITIRLVAVSELTGDIEDMLGSLADRLERSSRLRQQLLTSLMYPLIVVLMAGGVVAFLLVFLMPKLTAFVTRRGGALPPSTRFLMDASGFLQVWGLPLAVLLAMLVAGAVAWRRRSPGFALATDRAVLRLWVVGPCIEAAAMSLANAALGLLLKGGVGLVAALEAVAGVLGNQALALRYREAAQAVSGGQPMAPSLTAPIPPLVADLVAVGEAGGAVDEICEELASHYQELLQARTRLLATLFEPALILVVGGLVGFVYYAFFQAILSIVA
jgi:type IV pilus assembly protein PilC